MTLGEFLETAASDRGPWNCSTLPADWCVALGHPDFAAEWRTVVDAAECDVVGDLVDLWNEGIGAALPTIETTGELYPWDLDPGDIAVVAFGETQAGAIWTGQRLAIKAARGIHLIYPGALRITKAWRP